MTPNPSGPRPNDTAAHAMAAALRRHGVEVIFGQSIPSALFLVAPEFGIRQIGYRTENAGAAMADAYARVSHKVAVVTAQNGPAATLLVPGLAEAFKASVPVVAIVQDVHRRQTDKNAFQELDHLDLFKGCTKWIRRVTEADRIDDYVDMAFAAAASGRPGPAVLIVPIDVFAETPQASGQQRTAALGHYPLDRCVADPAAVRQAAEWLATARSPLVIAGGGVHLSDAAAELATLQDAAHLPVATTVMGKGAIDEGHPLSVGVVGYFMGSRGRTRSLRELVTEADVILLVGNRTNQNGTDSWSLYPSTARYIHIDVDGQEIGRNYEALRLVGDAKLTLAALTAALGERDLAQRQAARPALERRIAEGLATWRADVAATIDMDAAPLRPERLMRDLDSVLTPETIVVADASYSSIWIANFLMSRKAGMRFVTPRGLAGTRMGTAVCAGCKGGAARRSSVLPGGRRRLRACLVGTGNRAPDGPARRANGAEQPDPRLPEACRESAVQQLQRRLRLHLRRSRRHRTSLRLRRRTHRTAGGIPAGPAHRLASEYDHRARCCHRPARIPADHRLRGQRAAFLLTPSPDLLSRDTPRSNQPYPLSSKIVPASGATARRSRGRPGPARNSAAHASAR